MKSCAVKLSKSQRKTDFLFKCLLVTSHTLHFALFASSYNEFFLKFCLCLGDHSYKKQKKYIFIENRKIMWEIVILIRGV